MSPDLDLARTISILNADIDIESFTRNLIHASHFENSYTLIRYLIHAAGFDCRASRQPGVVTPSHALANVT